MNVPPAEVIEGLLDDLDGYVAAAGTLAIHDPLYALLSEPSDAALSALAEALRRHPGHPLAPAIQQALGGSLDAAPRTLGDVLRRYGPVPAQGELLDEVERRLRRAAEVERILRDRIATIEQTDRLLRRTTNALAAVGAMLAVFALIGWLIALGGWRVDWIEPPAPPPDEAAGGVAPPNGP